MVFTKFLSIRIRIIPSIPPTILDITPATTRSAPPERFVASWKGTILILGICIWTFLLIRVERAAAALPEPMFPTSLSTSRWMSVKSSYLLRAIIQHLFSFTAMQPYAITTMFPQKITLNFRLYRNDLYGVIILKIIREVNNYLKLFAICCISSAVWTILALSW